jgi:hypothetical protein
VTQKNNPIVVFCACAVVLVICFSQEARAADDSETQRQLQELRQQNQVLPEQIRQHGLLMESRSVKQKGAVFDVAPGTYRLKAWHERLPAQRQEITVTEDGVTKTDFVLGINNLPKASARPAQASMAR